MRVARLEQQSRHTRAGKLADVVAVRGNPLEDIKVPKSFVFVTGVAKDLPQRPLWHPIAPALNSSHRKLLHLHPGHRGVIHVVMTLIVIVGGPHLLGIGLIRVYMNHPAEQMRVELAARLLAVLPRRNGTQ